MICPICHTENRSSAKFCDECGAALASSASEEQPTVVFNGEEVESTSENLGETAATSPLDNLPTIEIDSSSYENLPEDDEFGNVPIASIGAGRADSDVTVAGLDRIVRDEQRDWHPGSTMKFPTDEVGDRFVSTEKPTATNSGWYTSEAALAVAGDEEATAGSGDALVVSAPEAKTNRKKAKKVILVIIVIAVICALAGYATYKKELWGGKSVPNVVGLSTADATDMLEWKGFKVVTKQVKSDDVEGIVLLSDPGSGARCAEGSEVIIHVSVSPVVPDIVGETLEVAQEAVAKEGLDNVTYVAKRSNEPENTVLSVSLDAGTKVKSGTTLTVTYAEAYTVPDVVGATRKDAESALSDDGYAPQISYVYSEDVEEGTVVSTDPAAGSKLNSGSNVTVYLAKSRKTEVIDDTRALFAEGTHLSIDGTSYEVVSLDSCSYSGNDTCSYSATVKGYETYYWFGVVPETKYTDPTQVSGSITWGSDNQVASSNPHIHKDE